MVMPLVYARLRSAVIANSRPMMSTTIHAGARSSCTSEMKAADVSSLSAIGSRICPSHVTCRRRRARYPTSQSVNDASALSWLRQLETSEHAGIRLIAAQATATRPDGAWLRLVRSLITDADPEVRREAAQLLAPHDPDAAKAALRPLLTHANPAEREAATLSFVQFVDDDLASLRRFLRTGDAETRVRAAARILELTR